MKWDNPQERDEALRLNWREFHRLYPARSRASYHSFRDDSRNGLRKGDKEEEQEDAAPQALSALERETVQCGGKRGRKKLTIAFGDLHFGDQGLLYECWQECMAASVEMAGQFQPAEIQLASPGDVASGRGIFRSQELRNILPLAQPQLIWVAWEIAEWVQRLREACPKAKIVGKNVKGNHDETMGENLAYELPIMLHLFEVAWQYCSRQAVINLAAEGESPFLASLEHGYGNSSYYPNSYTQIRGTWQELLDLDRRNEGQAVRRVIAGHTHWLNIGYALAPGRALDTVGGFQRQDRWNLAPTGRPVGFLAYRHDGRTLSVESITPRQETVDRLTDDPALDLRNGVTAFQQLLKVAEYMRQKGLTV